MASEVAVSLAKSVLAAANATGTHMGDTNGRLLGLLASQIDAAIDLVKEAGSGAADPKVLTIILLKKGLAIGGMAVDPSNEVGTCMVAVSGMALSLAAVVASAPTGIGIAVTGLGLLADAYAAYDGCKAPVTKAYNSMEDQGAFFMQRLQDSLMDYVNAQSAPFQ